MDEEELPYPHGAQGGAYEAASRVHPCSSLPSPKAGQDFEDLVVKDGKVHVGVVAAVAARAVLVVWVEVLVVVSPAVVVVADPLCVVGDRGQTDRGLVVSAEGVAVGDHQAAGPG